MQACQIYEHSLTDLFDGDSEAMVTDQKGHLAVVLELLIIFNNHPWPSFYGISIFLTFRTSCLCQLKSQD